MSRRGWVVGRPPGTRTQHNLLKRERSLADLWDEYCALHLDLRCARAAEHRKDFKRYFGELADLPLSEITPREVTVWSAGIASASGHATANKQLNRLRTLYNKALAWSWVDSNPASGKLVSRYRESPRERFVQEHEIGRLLKAIRAHKSIDAKHFFLLALMTGARKSSLRTMRYADISRDATIWTIPRQSMKGGVMSHPVPLVGQAQAIVSARRWAERGAIYAFRNRRDAARPINHVDRWWHDIRDAAELPDVTIHDLRRTLGSWMAITGASFPIIAQMLGHKMPGVTHIYARLALGPVRAAAQLAIDTIMEAAEE